MRSKTSPPGRARRAMFGPSPRAGLRRRALTGSALLTGLGAVAIAADVLQTTSVDFDAGPPEVQDNVSTASDQLALLSVDFDDLSFTDGFTYWRSFTDFSTTETLLEVEKDDATVFDGQDDCIAATGTPLSDTDTLVVNGRTYRGGPWTSGGFAAAVAGGGTPDLLLDFAGGDGTGRLAGLSEVRFLTSGTHGAVAIGTYTVTFDYASAPDEVVVVSVKHDSVSGTLRDTITADATVEYAGLTDAGSACGAGDIDEVVVPNPDPSTPALVTIDWQEDDGIAASWLEGPLAVSIAVEEATYDSLYDYAGTYTSGDTVLDAGGHALWHEATLTQTRNGGAVRLWVTCSEDGVTFDDPALYGGPYEDPADGSAVFGVVDGLSASPSQACAGRYAKTTVQLLSGFDDPTGPTVQDVTLSFEPDADMDGYDPGGILTAADCDDADGAVHPGAAEIPGNAVDEDCDGTVTCYEDLDGDGYGTGVIADLDGDGACTSPGEAMLDGDCDDTLDAGADRFPNNVLDPADVADGIDQDCDGFDECFADGADGDGHALVGAAIVPDSGDGICDDPGEAATADDCDDVDPNRYGGFVVTQNEIDDGVDNDCDGADRDECWTDADLDGHGIATVRQDDGDGACQTASGEASTLVDDCDDGDPNRYPDFVVTDDEVEDGVDNDCDGADRDECWRDLDGDGFGGIGRVVVQDNGDGACDDPNESAVATDCLDTGANAASVYPGKVIGQADIENTLDNDCDGVDECWTDADLDGYGVAVAIPDDGDGVCDAADGESATADDCADDDPDRHPNFVITQDQIDDGVDNDCDGADRDECWVDADQDGHGVPTAKQDNGDGACNAASQESILADDCADANAQRHPGFAITQTQIDDGVDNDCDGSNRDECWTDADGDDHGNALGLVTQDSGDGVCDDGTEALSADDCDDANAQRYPGFVITQTQIDDGVDNDCDGADRDECWTDADGDDHGNALGLVTQDSGDGVCDDATEALSADDCDDGNDQRYPGFVITQDQIDDGVDNDCLSGDECWLDADRDGHGVGTVRQDGGDGVCTLANQESLLDDDCDDGNAGRNPSLVEIPGNGVDEDCDLVVTCFQDLDGDGFGSVIVILDTNADGQCTTAAGESTLGTDCDDARALTNPSAFDTCGNGIDDDCDGLGAHGDNAGLPGGFLDDDGDGLIFGADPDDCADDLDGDGLPDDDEVLVIGSDPANPDSDGDGVGDLVEVGGDRNNPRDTDGDGTPDVLDPDDDGDGVPTLDEDTDGSGSPRNDDTDSDGIVDYLDDDDDGDTLLTATEVYGAVTDPQLQDSDTDGVPDYLDDDDDDDGIVTFDELVDAAFDLDGDLVPNYLDLDSDGDGWSDAHEYLETPALDADHDGDGLRDYVDPDSDNDTVPDADELGDESLPRSARDTDGDGAEDRIDADDDGDGLPTSVEDPDGSGSPLDDDTDGDTLPDFRDDDDDGDRVDTSVEDRNGNGNLFDDDTDGDGIPDFLDDDDDGDRLDSALEDLNGNGNPLDDDTDGDGIPNFRDDDDDNDLVLTRFEDRDGDLDPRDDDTDGDLVPDYLDPDDDGDLLLTRDEDLDGDDDPRDDDTDGDALPNYLDPDDDDDGVPTRSEDVDRDGDPRSDDTDDDGLPDYRDPDDDGDTRLTSTEAYDGNLDPLAQDSDDDGTPDYRDTDDDGDGIPTTAELKDAAFDFDEDGTPNYLDLDSDGDGWSDAFEFAAALDPSGDSDGDGARDYVDLDSDDDSVVDDDELGTEAGGIATRDTDGDGIPNRLDPDDDGDGVPTIDEDTDGDGSPIGDNTDGGGRDDYLDEDDDNDGVLTIDESPDGDPFPLNDDTDGDGIPNYRDTDDDGDAILTVDEDLDANGDPRDDDPDVDGIPSFLDADDDGDGVPTRAEDYDGDAIADPDAQDSDLDGIPDWLDTDDDGDRIPTRLEDLDGDGDPRNDNTDGDALPDYRDIDDDGDNVSTLLEDLNGNANPLDDDTDGDGIPDARDADDDGDGVPTRAEDYDGDNNPRDQDSDSDGTADYLDADDDGDGVSTRDEDLDADGDPTNDNSDGDALPNFRDTDDDGDGVATRLEDRDGDGRPRLDDGDGDGIPDWLDVDDDDDGIPTAGEDLNANGSRFDDDSDGDGIPNFRDDDDDGDTVPTLLEDLDGDGDPRGDDGDGDGIEDYLDTDDDGDTVPTRLEDVDEDGTALGDDTDGDGIPDFRDTDDDGDRVPTASERYGAILDPRLQDSDADGTPDFRDADDDGDRVPTAAEAYGAITDPRLQNTDGDALPDYRDTDDDGDGATTLQEDVDGSGDPRTDDTDGDALPNYRDTDDDGDGLLTVGEDLNGNGSPVDDDFDFDGIPNYIDADDDDDGVPTQFEVSNFTDPLDPDTDNDLITDGAEWLNGLLTDPDVDCAVSDCADLGGGTTGLSFADPWDRDGDGIINASDADDDGDGIISFDEGNVDSECAPLGAPVLDGIPNYLDFDSDGDGLLDSDEGNLDDDGDYRPNFLDCDASGCAGDSDFDGIPNCRDEQLFGAGASVDPDADDDGIADGDEVGPDPGCVNPDHLAVACAAQDTDGDGTIDALDTDDDGDGFPTHVEVGACPDGSVPEAVCSFATYACAPTCADGTVLVPQNTDAPTGGVYPLEPDGIPDFLDADDDGDGAPSFAEGDGDRDGDGLPNYLDPNDWDGPVADADGDGLTNDAELALGLDPYGDDSDGDGIADSLEIGDPARPTDTDGDGTIDALDPDDDGDGLPTELEGRGDTDGDGTPDYLDPDADGDGVPDAEEGDGDADCDSIPNWVDPDDADSACVRDTGDGITVLTNEGGCGGCASTGATPVGGWVLGLLALATRRRRERSERPVGALEPGPRRAG